MKEDQSPRHVSLVARASRTELFTELYRLICFFHASPSISSDEDEIGKVPAMQLLAEEVQDSEIVKTLLVAAMQLRLIDDDLIDGQQELRKHFEANVGRLWHPRTSTPQPLSMREGCNKVIHSKDIGFFVDENRYDPESFLTSRFLLPRLALYGKQGKEEWRAELDVNGFVESGYWLKAYGSEMV